MIDKSMYAAPQGIDALGDQQDGDIEIEVIDDDEPAENPDPVPEVAAAFEANLVDSLDDETISIIVTDLDFQTDNDRRSRSDWESTYKKGLKLLGLKPEERTEPWDGACGVVHPMITEAVVRFQAECMTETFPASGPVRSKILGKETPEKKESAQRVEEDMNWELTENMPEFRNEHERLLWELPGGGCAFKKVYYDPSKGRQVSNFVPAEDVLLPYGTTNLMTCERITHVMRMSKNNIIKLMEAGFYREFDLGDAPRVKDDIKEAKDRETGFTDINDDRFTIHEVHVDLVIDGDPERDKSSQIAYPYVVSYIKETSDVLSIRRNWREEDTYRCKRDHFVQYDYIPGLGAYGYGLFHLVGGYAAGATSILRQLIDAGTLSNLPGGLKSRGLRIKGEDTPIAPGEFRDVDVGGGSIRDAILPLPYKEPSAVLAALLDKIIDEGRRFAATADLQVSDMSAQAPVGTTLALIERQLKVMSAVQARVHDSLKKELKLLKEIIRDYTPDEYTYDPATGNKSAKKADYDSVEILPVSDPSAATMAQRVVQHQAAIQMAQMSPEIYDLPHLHREMLEALGFKNAAKIVPLPDDLKPQDPITENMQILRSEPIKAFSHQDHQSHLGAHQALANDPMIQQMIGQNPKAPMMMAALQAHIAEHMAYDYRRKIEAALGIVMPPEGEDLPPEVEIALSQMQAQAAMQVQQQNQMQAAAQAAQQAAQDPLVQIQMREVATKERKVAVEEGKLKLDGVKVLADAAFQSDTIDLEAGKTAGDMAARGMELGHQMQMDRTQHAHTQDVHKTDTAFRVIETGLDTGMKMADHRQTERMADRAHTEQRLQNDKQAADQKEAAAQEQPAAKPPKGKK
jgi:hypothetical protein